MGDSAPQPGAALAEAVGQRLALQVLHDEVLSLALAVDVLNREMCGCEICEIAFASRSNRWRSSGENERCAGRTLIATVRSIRASRS